MRSLVAAGVLTLATASAIAAMDAPADATRADEQALKDAHVGTSDSALLEAFQKWILTPADRVKVAQLIRQLDDDSYEARDEASEDLVDFGPAAVPLLREAVNSPRLEVSRRARRCLKRIEAPSVDVLTAAARLLAVRKPAGTAQTLLAYLPGANDEQLAGEIENTLTALAFAEGRPSPTLVSALHDPQVTIRLAAAEALAQAGGRQAVLLLRPLLHDADTRVRLHVAMRLADSREADAIDVLIALVGTKTAVAGQADGYLRELAGAQAPAATPGPTDASRAASRAAWHQWWAGIDAPALLARIRRGTPDEAARQKTAALIDELGDDSFVVRERASEELIHLGTVAVALLQKATEEDQNPDAEVRHRARLCLSSIEQGPNPGVSAATIRVVSLRKPPGSAEALLAYLPFASGDVDTEEVEKALAAVAYQDGRPAQALLAALHDPLALKRATAGVALTQGGVAPPVSVQTLLRDRDPEVRLPVAMALVARKDRAAVPALIDILGELSPEQLWQAEELLRRLSGSQAPPTALGTDATSRRQCRDAWAAWWRTNSARVDMTVLDSAPRMLGYTLIVQFTQWGNNTGRVYEIGPDRKVRWHVDGLNLPIDAQIVGRNHVLVAEYYGSVVTERDFKGKIVWQQQANNPVSVQRLPNGNTFIAGQNEILEVNRAGESLYTFSPPGGCMAARKLRDGQIVAVSNSGTLSRMDKTGKVIKSFSVGQVNLGGLDVLPNGHVLVPQTNMSKVVEYDQDGKTIWQHSFNWPSSAVRLPNGNTLIASQNMQQIVEVDRAGKTVWDHRPDGRPWHARRR